MTVRTRSATYPDRETAHWATQQVVTRNEQKIHRWLAQGTRARLTIEAAWPSREAPVGRVLLQAMMLAGCEPVDVRAARVVLRREQSSPHGFVVLTTVPIYL
ncbi:RNase A-like domain-containing protein [Streptomyces sp. NPDC127039]|uniref:RNase A-like domain-containing protein n=1 Tax=Streptomyces sp. NPDC127039 TaxID=3347115 RepID=UPI0036516DD7